MFQNRYAAMLLAAAALAGLSSAAQASPIGPDVIVNGDFEQTNMPNGPSQIDNSNVTGWSTNGYNFIFAANGATAGSYTPQFQGNVSLWNPGNGSNNGFTNSPTGGNFVAADGAFQSAPISQALNNLTVGDTYAVTFSWAAAQQFNYDGNTTEAWQVGFGDQSQTTSTYQLSSHGFSGWMLQTFDFTASASTQVLSFLAVGTPAGEPPFSLLDGVSARDIPEPAAWALLLGGVASIAVLRRRKPGASLAA